MLNPTAKDYQQLQGWPMTADPLAFIRQFSSSQLWLRGLKPQHLNMHYVYWRRRAAMAKADVDVQEYYKEVRITHRRDKWGFLKLRKSWFIVPLHWERFARPDCARVLDAGCGDGDVTQRVVEFIEQEWRRTGQAHDVEVTGVDHNASRIENARGFCSATSGHIKLDFKVVDTVQGLPFPDRHFDYAVCTGVLEILSDEAARDFVANLCRVVKKGIYIEVQADRYPGGFPRDDMGSLFEPNGFRVEDRHWQLTEPFSLGRMPCPCWRDMTWPIHKDQVFWAMRPEGR